MKECLMGLEGKVTEGMNHNLLRVFTPEEVNNALNQIHPLKSPGTNGMSFINIPGY